MRGPQDKESETGGQQGAGVSLLTGASEDQLLLRGHRIVTRTESRSGHRVRRWRKLWDVMFATKSFRSQ